MSRAGKRRDDDVSPSRHRDGWRNALALSRSSTRAGLAGPYACWACSVALLQARARGAPIRDRVIRAREPGHVGVTGEPRHVAFARRMERRRAALRRRSTDNRQRQHGSERRMRSATRVVHRDSSAEAHERAAAPSHSVVRREAADDEHVALAEHREPIGVRSVACKVTVSGFVVHAADGVPSAWLRPPRPASTLTSQDPNGTKREPRTGSRSPSV